MAFEASSKQDGAQREDVRQLQRIAGGDRDAFSRLFESYYPRVFRFLFRLTKSHSEAEELSNDVLLTLWNDAAKFRGDSKVSTWIFGIAYRKALANLRKRKLKWVAIEDEHAVDDLAIAQFEESDWVRHGIDALPDKQRLTIMLVYFLGMSCEETALATGVPTSTVKTRMFHARRKLKLHLVASGLPESWKADGDNERI